MDISDVSAGARRRAERALDQAWDRGDLASSEAVRIVLDALTTDHPALGAAAVALQRWSDAGSKSIFVIQEPGKGYTDVARVVINAVENYEAEQADSARAESVRADVCGPPDPEFAVGDEVEWYHGSTLQVGQIIPNDAGRVLNAEDYYHIDRGEGFTSYVRKGAVRSATPQAPWIPKVGDAVEWHHDGKKHYGKVTDPPRGAGYA
jgi:surface antigen